jgi:hypothetical protein
LIRVPIVLSGLHLPNVNNPVLVGWAWVDAQIVQDIPKGMEKFISLLVEASGFNCAPRVSIKGKIPKLSYYVVLSKEIVRVFREQCGVPIKENEEAELLELLDRAIFDSNYVEALRALQKGGEPLLYRRGEDPVSIKMPELAVEPIMWYPLNGPSFMDNSLIHLAGMVTVKTAEAGDLRYLSQENGVWSVAYGLPTPLVPNLKWVWDNDALLLRLADWN